MLRILIEFAVATAVLLLFTIPVSRVALERGRKDAPRRWRRGAAICGFAVAILGWSSRDLIQKCIEARYNGCVDIGSAGMRFLLICGFGGWALLSAYLLHND